MVHSVVSGAAWIAWSWLLFFWMGTATLNKVRNSFSFDQVMVAINHIYLDIFLFSISQFFILFVLTLIIYLISLPIIKKINGIKRPILWVYFVSLLVVYNLILLHEYKFPYSSHPMGGIIPKEVGVFLLIYYLPTFLLFISLLFSLRYWFVEKCLNKFFLLIIVIIPVLYFFSTYKSSYFEAPLKKDLPNIIVIGLDSYDLTDLEVGRVGSINQFVDNSVLFENTKTTLARTYVAWNSLLTGRYPINNGVRFNLNPRDEGSENYFLINDFKKNGYKAYYSSDEMRFSNLGEYHGFDGVIGAKVGALDFLLGTLTDMPFSNLLLGSPLGKYFFPYAYGNRAIAHAYDPENYFDLLNSGLDDIQKGDYPVFLSLHLCLAHWPYYYGDTSNGADGYKGYKNSINSLNAMAGELLDNLKNRGILENAVVVFMSDHGEGFPDKYGKERGYFSSYGHGNNLLDEDQNRILFAVQQYKNGIPEFKPARFDYPTSIMDILPTVADIVDVNLDDKSIDGFSMLPLIRGDYLSLPAERPRFLETEIHLKAIEDSNVGSDLDLDSLVDEAIKYYRISPDGRLEINEINFPELLTKKDRAVELNGEYLVWNDVYGYKIFNYLNKYSNPYEPSNVAHKKLMDLFCTHFFSDLNLGYLPDRCEEI